MLYIAGAPLDCFDRIQTHARKWFLCYSMKSFLKVHLFFRDWVSPTEVDVVWLTSTGVCETWVIGACVFATHVSMTYVSKTSVAVSWVYET